MSQTMKAVVFNGVREVNVEDRPIPQIKDERDIVVKVEYTGLCGRFVAYLLNFNSASHAVD